MKLKDKYCIICGRKRDVIESDTYDETTGKKVFRHAVCPVENCKHGNHAFNFKVFGKTKCEVCGININETYPFWG